MAEILVVNNGDYDAWSQLYFHDTDHQRPSAAAEKIVSDTINRLTGASSYEWDDLEAELKKVGIVRLKAVPVSETWF